MNIFQKLYDGIKNWTAPQWLKTFLSDLQIVIIQVAKAAGQAYIQYLEAKIIEAANNGSLTSEQKFQYVWDAAKGSAIPAIVSLKDSELNLIIESIANLLKSKGTIA